MTKLVVPPMPELPVSLHKPGDHLYGNINRLREWGSLGWQAAQREAALADELADLMWKIREHTDPKDAFVIQILDGALDRYAKHKEAR